MKKLISFVLVLVLTMSVASVFAANTEIFIDGKKAEIAPGLGEIVEKDSRTFVPVRFLLEYLGFNVEWIDSDQSVLGRNAKDESFIMQVGNKNLFYFGADGLQKELPPMDVAPFLNYAESRTYVPLRFIAEAMGYKVGWDGATGAVTLVSEK